MWQQCIRFVTGRITQNKPCFQTLNPKKFGLHPQHTQIASDFHRKSVKKRTQDRLLVQQNSAVVLTGEVLCTVY